MSLSIVRVCTIMIANFKNFAFPMSKNRSELLQNIKSLQRLMPSEDYSLYIKQAQQKYLQFVPPHSFLPAMDEKSPKSLNDVELNVLSKSRNSYLNNAFIPGIVEKQPEILKDSASDSVSDAIERWSDKIRKAASPEQLIRLINQINQRKRLGSTNQTSKPFWKRIFGL